MVPPTPPAQVVVVDDDPDLRSLIGGFLREHQFAVTTAADSKALNARLAENPPVDIILLDVMMPGEDGLSVLRRMDGPNRPGIIVLSAMGDDDDRIEGLELGADDYLAKPCNPRELLARIRAVLRRRGDISSAVATTRATPVLRFGSLEIDRDARMVQVAGAACELTSYQFDLLVALAERAGRVLTRDQIMEAVRGRELEAFDRSIDVHIGRIRNAIEADSKEPKRILTVRGVGYVFAKQQD
jgi:DNA-binding response OmpR family regulator